MICIQMGASRITLTNPAASWMATSPITMRDSLFVVAAGPSRGQRRGEIGDDVQRNRHGDHRMPDAQPDEHMHGGRNILAQPLDQRSGREQRVAQRSHRAAHPDEHHADEADHPSDSEDALAAQANRRVAGSPPGCQRGRTKQQKGVRQVDRHDDGSRHRLVACHKTQEHQARAHQHLDHLEDEDGDHRFADGMSLGESSEAPNDQETTRTRLNPEVMRCANSMMVSNWGASGTGTPLHSGQWLPQPAPEPLARTNAPQRMTNRL